MNPATWLCEITENKAPGLQGQSHRAIVGISGLSVVSFKYLASHGVLVVGSLTDDELVACDLDPELREAPMERAEVAASVRERLERYARGIGGP
jgi:hypothetical protein